MSAPKKGSPGSEETTGSKPDDSKDESKLDEAVTKTDDETKKDEETKGDDKLKASVTTVDPVVREAQEPRFVVVNIIETVSSCLIGGKLYSFRAGTPAKVPVDVARHLRQTGVASAE